jgi:hypothetical protein
MAIPTLRFEGGPVSGKLNGWTGPWPPPERLGVAVGRDTGIVAYFEESALEEKGVALEELERLCSVTFYRRAEFSTLPDEVDALENVSRAARYVEEP